MANQQMKAICIAISQWSCEQRSSSTVMPADAQAAPNVSVEVTCVEQHTVLSDINTNSIFRAVKNNRREKAPQSTCLHYETWGL